MFKFLGNKKLFILLIGLICFIALMGFTLERKGSLVWPEKFVKDTVSWTQKIVYKPISYVSNFFMDLQNLRTLYTENKVLKQTIFKYAKDTAKLNELEAENKRYKELLGFTERQIQATNYRYHIANVISLSMDPYNSTVVIDLGAKDGIKENMAVVSAAGLLGRVVVVSEFSSNVQLLSGLNDAGNDSKAIVVTAKGKDSFGIVESYDMNTGLLVMNKIPQTDPLEVGDTIITSNMGRIFPPGIEVGEVISRLPGDFGLDYKALIRPFVTFERLQEVFVVEVPGQG